jgi:ABC-type transporter Mla subunit MlaD
MRQSRAARLTASPVLVGALTTLIVIVAVFLAYNANNGLPFVPTYGVSTIVPDANSLVEGNDVRVGGVRVGTIQKIVPVATTDPKTGQQIYAAKLDLKLDRSVDPLPVDSDVIVRTRSALGLKYLQITPGRSSRGLPEGGTLGLARARPEPVELDQLFNTFQEPVRRAIQQNLVEFGGAIAGRGPDLNAAIGQLQPLVIRLIPVMRNLSSPQTDLSGFFHGLEQASAEVAPVAQEQADMFVGLDRTFSALAAVSRPFIQQSITRGVTAENTAIDTLPRIRPFLAHSTALFHDFLPAANALASSSPILARTFKIGVPVLRTTPILNAQLPPTAEALLRFSRNQDVLSGIDALRRTANILDPTLSFVTPSQTVCHYPSILLRNAGETVSSGSGPGTWLRSITIVGKVGVGKPLQPNSEFSPSSAPANGPQTVNHLHYNPYPNTAAPGQTHECEAGNEPYIKGRTVIGNVPGNQGTITDHGS